MKSDREKQSLKGAVKSINNNSTFVTRQNGQTVERQGFSLTTLFNRDGFITEQFHQNPDGSKWRIVYDYFETGKLLAAKSYHNSDTPNSETKYIYDNQGTLKAIQFKNQNDKLTTFTNYTYDREGRKLKIQELPYTEGTGMAIGIEGVNFGIGYSNGLSRSETLYDEQDNEIELKIFNLEGNLVGRVEIIRDEIGNPLEVTSYNGHSDEETAGIFAPGAVMFQHINKYDESGNLIETRQIMMGMETERQTFTYDKAGNKIEETHYQNGSLDAKTTFTRDYDDNGNWTKEQVFTLKTPNTNEEQKRPISMTLRTISYYE